MTCNWLQLQSNSSTFEAAMNAIVAICWLIFKKIKSQCIAKPAVMTFVFSVRTKMFLNDMMILCLVFKLYPCCYIFDGEVFFPPAIYFISMNKTEIDAAAIIQSFDLARRSPQLRHLLHEIKLYFTQLTQALQDQMQNHLQSMCSILKYPYLSSVGLVDTYRRVKRGQAEQEDAKTMFAELKRDRIKEIDDKMGRDQLEKVNQKLKLIEGKIMKDVLELKNIHSRREKIINCVRDALNPINQEFTRIPTPPLSSSISHSSQISDFRREREIANKTNRVEKMKLKLKINQSKGIEDQPKFEEYVNGKQMKGNECPNMFPHENENLMDIKLPSNLEFKKDVLESKAVLGQHIQAVTLFLASSPMNPAHPASHHLAKHGNSKQIFRQSKKQMVRIKKQREQIGKKLEQLRGESEKGKKEKRNQDSHKVSLGHKKSLSATQTPNKSKMFQNSNLNVESPPKQKLILQKQIPFYPRTNFHERERTNFHENSLDRNILTKKQSNTPQNKHFINHKLDEKVQGHSKMHLRSQEKQSNSIQHKRKDSINHTYLEQDIALSLHGLSQIHHLTPSESIKLLQKILARSLYPNLTIAESLTFLYLEEGKAQKCLQLTEKYLKILDQKDSIRLIGNKAAALNQLGKYRQAVSLLQPLLIKIHNSSVDHNLRSRLNKTLADSYFSLNSHQDAQQFYLYSLELDPFQHECHFNLAVCNYLSQQFKSAHLRAARAFQIKNLQQYKQLMEQAAKRILQ